MTRRLLGLVLGWLVLASVVVLGSTPSPVAAQSGACRVGLAAGTATEWTSDGRDATAVTLAREAGVGLVAPAPGFVWVVPVCVAGSGDVAVTGPVRQEVASSSYAEESAASAETLEALAGLTWRPEPLLSPARDGEQVVGLQSWLAVDPGTWVTIGPVSRTSGAVTVTATATPVATVWSFADGLVVECDGPGELFTAGQVSGEAACGREWEHTTRVQPQAVEVTIRYRVAWSSSIGGSGVLVRNGGSLGAFPLRVGEIQSVGVVGDRDRPSGANLGGRDGSETLDCSLVDYVAGRCDDRTSSTDGPAGEQGNDGECGVLTEHLQDTFDQQRTILDGLIGWVDIPFQGQMADWATRAFGWTVDTAASTFIARAEGAGGADLANTLAALGERYGDEISWTVDQTGALAGFVGNTSGVTPTVRLAFDQGGQLVATVADTEQGQQIASGLAAAGRCVSWVSSAAYESFPAEFRRLPIFGGLSLDAIIGCGKVALDTLSSGWGLITTTARGAEDPEAFVAEQAQVLSELIAYVQANPEQFVNDVLSAAVDRELLEQGGTEQWSGAVACQVAAAFLTGGTLTTAAKTGRFGNQVQRLVTKLDDALPSNRRNRPDDCNSFPTGTPVLMADGTHKPIELIQPGDLVLAHNLTTGQWRPQPVLAQWSHLDDGHMATALLDDGSSITATDHHQFWVDNHGRWLELDDLSPGDVLLTPTGVMAVAALNVAPPAETLVWEIDVATDDNYTVHTGTTDLLVHNCDLDSADLGELLGSGGEKDVYAYDEDSVVGVLRDGRSPSALVREVELLNQLEELGLPVVNARLIKVDGQDAILYDRYALGSKEIVRTVNKEPSIVGNSSLLNARSVSDLRAIREHLLRQRIRVNDLQFLIASDGSVVIADPLGVRTDSKPSLNNLKTIDRLIEAAGG